MKKKILLLGISSLLALPVVASADDFGCEALLCFAGGKGVAECQPTIRKVLRDLSKGKSFPHCNFVGGNDSSSGVDVKQYVENWRGKTCRDGVTKPYHINRTSYCKTIEINIDPQYAADPNHQKQFYNY